jgi:hypothetical protein
MSGFVIKMRHAIDAAFNVHDDKKPVLLVAKISDWWNRVRNVIIYGDHKNLS